MKTVLRLEELGLFILSIYLFSRLHFAWWWFPALILAPDLSAIGYAFNNKLGAICYNFFHHKGIAALTYILGAWLGSEWTMLIGLILLGHSSMDRVFGYGLKYFTGFKYTHLGVLGKEN